MLLATLNETTFNIHSFFFGGYGVGWKVLEETDLPSLLLPPTAHPKGEGRRIHGSKADMKTRKWAELQHVGRMDAIQPHCLWSFCMYAHLQHQTKSHFMCHLAQQVCPNN